MSAPLVEVIKKAGVWISNLCYIGPQRTKYSVRAQPELPNFS